MSQMPDDDNVPLPEPPRKVSPALVGFVVAVLVFLLAMLVLA